MKYVFATASLLALSLASASTHAQNTSVLTYNDVFNFEVVADPQISPDGATIVYQRRSNSIMKDRAVSSLWRVDYDGDNHRPLMTGDRDYTSARWSPDGTKLAFVASENGKTFLRVLWLANDQVQTLAILETGASDLSWSPNGQHLAFTAFTPAPDIQIDLGLPAKPQGAEWAETALVDESVYYEFDGAGEITPGTPQVYVISSQGGTPHQLTHITDGGAGGLIWAGNSALIYSVGFMESQNFDFRESDLHRVDLNGVETQLTDFPGAEGSPSLSPDGRTLAYLGGPNDHRSNIDANLYVMPVEGGTPREVLSALDKPLNDVVWDPSGRSLWISYDDRGQRVLAQTNMEGRIDVRSRQLGGEIFGRPYTSGDFSISRNGRYAATIADAYDLANVGVGQRGNSTRQITDINSDVFDALTLGRVEEMTWQSSADGLEIQGWIVYPPNFDPNQRYPMILEIHGGPHTAYGPNFSTEVQLMAAAGYVVLYTNPRGSTSYSEAFANEIDKNYPGQDADDLLSGVDSLVARGFIDENRLFVTGGSGGGVLTAWLIGMDQRFAAAAVGKPVINWTSFVLSADIGPMIQPSWFGTMPWDDQENYWRRSPLSLVGNVETPTLVFVGGDDRRTPVHEAEQYYIALQLRDIPSRFVRIPGVGHGIADSRPTRLMQKVSHILTWFEAYDPAKQDTQD
ncbi:alpha/beta hydrolase family protein [Woodsholea maritima]|uniref:alpha/beta hydrolase family protein n=1 Tax=Woodsholea maritima TaxID=240237 RepID=UPI0003668FDD|nr:S9 family peptidase [Woodsholea maritima]